MSPSSAVSSYLTLFILTEIGGIVSVVLSLPLRAVAVSDYFVLCCPDFPLENLKRLPFKLPVILAHLSRIVYLSLGSLPCPLLRFALVLRA